MVEVLFFFNFRLTKANDMKQVKAIITALIIVVVILSFLFIQERRKNDQYQRMERGMTIAQIIEDYFEITTFLGAGNNQQDNFTPEVTEFTGSPLTPEEAKVKKTKFDIWNFKPAGKRRISPYAFAFGTQRLQNLLNAIDIVNQPYDRMDTAFITGVRAYLVESYADSTNNKDDWHIDLMFVPVNAQGNDVLRASRGYKLSDGDTTQLLLNRSAPCPNNCGVEQPTLD